MEEELVVLAEPLAVVGGDRNHGIGAVAESVERTEQGAELGVRERDLAVVERLHVVGVGHALEPGMPLARMRPQDVQAVVRGRARITRSHEARVVGSRRGVRGVRVEQVDPDEEGPLAGMRLEPGERRLHHLVGAPLAGKQGNPVPARQVAAGEHRMREVVVVDGKALREAETVIERHAAHERGRLVALAGEYLRERGLGVCQQVETVREDAMGKRVAAGHQARVRGRGDGRDGICLGEAHAVGRQPVERWRR